MNAAVITQCPRPPSEGRQCRTLRCAAELRRVASGHRLAGAAATLDAVCPLDAGFPIRHKANHRPPDVGAAQLVTPSTSARRNGSQPVALDRAARGRHRMAGARQPPQGCRRHWTHRRPIRLPYSTLPDDHRVHARRSAQARVTTSGPQTNGTANTADRWPPGSTTKARRTSIRGR